MKKLKTKIFISLLFSIAIPSRGTETTDQDRQCHRLTEAIRDNDSNKINQLLVLDRFSLDEQGEFGWTPLTQAADRQEGEDLTLVRELVNQGADINKPNQYRWTALMLASYNSSSALVSFLLERGADPSKVNNQGKTAWDLAGDNSEIKEIFDKFTQK